MVKFYIGGVLIAIIFFFIGLQIGKTRQVSNANYPGNRNFNGGQMMGNQTGIRNSMRGGGFITGTIVSSDDKSVTVSLKDGGSKTIYISDTTSVLKSSTGKKTDLVNGSTIMVNGTSNQDGSIAAQSIQIRPEIQQ